MKKLFFAVLCITVMFMAGTNLKAQEVTLELLPGWNWIAYPYCETVDLTTAFGSFTPMTGDIIKSQYGSSSFRYGQWRGAVQNLNAGEGYHYFSTRTEPVILVFGLPSIPIGPLTVTTSEPTNITSTTATCGGSAVSNDGTSILMKGVCWATHPQPTTNDSYSEDVNAPGDFTTTITELDPETVYYVRAYAVSVKGINYGEELSFTTSSPGILNGLFSVSENNQVYFSQGNLQYQASTNTWRFAENQWDYVGDNTLGTVYENGVKSDNALISSTYDGWIDLFCWGTGNDPTHVSPRPWEVFVDWGINPITNGGNYPNQWLTLSLEELWYLFNSRNTPSGIRFVKAVVNDINGIVLLPDDWQESYYTLNNPNSGNSSYASNTISLDDWALLESYGAVFFPAAGMRYGNIYDSGSRGQYWSCTDMYFDDRGHTMAFSDEGFSIGEGLAYYKDFGQSVRLVQFVQTPSFNINATPNHEEYGSVNGGGVYELGQTCTLTAVPNEGYTFVNWKTDGIVVSTENTYSFTVRSNKNYVANFYENSTYPLTYSYNEDDHTATVTGRVEGVELGELVIPETVLHNGDFYTVTAIGQWAFADCMSLASVSIPNTVTAIGAQAFIYCYNLVSVSLPSGITLIPHGLFQSCGNLASITIPSGVTFISSYAFLECNSLASLTVLAETPPVLDNESLGDIFIDVDKTIPVYIPCGTLEAYQNAEGWNEFTNIVGICPGTITVTASPAEYGTVTGGGSFEGGETCTVTATPNEGYYFLCWMENDQVVSTEATYTFTVTGNRSLTAIFYVTLGEENVVNGDFEQGNVGFTSAFEYNSNLFDAGTYYVDNNASLHHPNFGGHGHGGTGNFMIVNGATIPETNVWTEQLTVTSNTYYTFSTWVCTVAGGSPAVLQFSINGNQIGEVFSAPSQTNTWQHFYVLWYSGNSTTATITILNQNTEGIGNDFGLDDISFREINPVQGGIPEGAINGKFTINENGDQVYFSQGNLQYQASTNTWKFAENQYDYVGSDNSNISSTYDGWIDLFGWGTSGYNHGANCYQPWSISRFYDNYYAYSDSYYNLNDQTGQADWGYNPISNGCNQPNQWRTLTNYEWWFLLYQRTTTSGIRYVKACVNGVNGVILLPDDWSTDIYSLSNTNNNEASFNSNVISASQWTTLENAGAVFLSAAGNRDGTLTNNIGSNGNYWSASNYYGSGSACCMDFNASHLYTTQNYRYCGFSVRVVCPAEN